MSTIDWNAICAIATAIMSIATFVTIVVNIKQLRELKRQWLESQRPKINITICVQSDLYVIKVENNSSNCASNVRFHFNSLLKENLFAKQLCDTFRSIEDVVYSIPAFTAKYFWLIPISDGNKVHQFNEPYEVFSGKDVEIWKKTHSDEMIEVTCTYDGDTNTGYKTRYRCMVKDLDTHFAKITDPQVDAVLKLEKTVKHLTSAIEKRNI